MLKQSITSINNTLISLSVRSQYGHCNQLPDIEVKYLKKEKNKDIPKSRETIRAMTACLNSRYGGMFKLKKVGEHNSEEDFDKELDLHFGSKKLNQFNHYNIVGSRHDPERLVFIKAVDQKKLLSSAHTHAYTREDTQSVPIHSTKELMKKLKRRRRRGQQDTILPILPRSCRSCQFLDADTKVEGEKIEFKSVKEKNIFKSKDDVEEELTKYVSSFANTIGGRLFFGIQDDGNVVGMNIKSKGEFHRKVDTRISKMCWFKAGVGLVHPKENEHWKLDFIDVEGDDNKVVAVLTIPPLEVGLVFTKEPECPVLDTTKAEGYRMLSFEEWCTYLTGLLKEDSGRCIY